MKREREQIGFRCWQSDRRDGDFFHAEICLVKLTPRHEKLGYYDTEIFDISFLKPAGPDAKPDADYFLYRLEVKPDATSVVHPIMQQLRAQINKLHGLRLSNDYDCYVWACKQIFTEIRYETDQYACFPVAA